MIGNSSAPGVMVLTMHELFERMKAEDERTYDIKISYLEVYNETIRDLLVPNSKNLDLRDSEGRDVVVAGLSTHHPKSASEVLTLLEEGNLRRCQSPTDANAQSSRSHAILQVMVHSRNRTGNVTAAVRSAKLSLVDLAGSERAAKTNNRGARLVEGANINKSLLSLGNCINALSKSAGGQKVYVPYRNSKLTRLLKDSLCGNCKTVMIANVSPSSLSFEDTHNTLQYANRAKNIRTTIKRNEVNVKYHVSQYKTIINDLRREVTDLKAQNAQKEDHHLVKELRQKRQVLVSDRTKLNRLIEEVIVGEDKLISNSELDEKSIYQLRKLDQVKCELIQSLREIGKKSRNLRYEAENTCPDVLERDLVIRDLDIDALELYKLESELGLKSKDISIKKLTVRCLQLTSKLREKEAIIQDQAAILKENSLLPSDMDQNDSDQTKEVVVETDESLLFEVIEDDTHETFKNNYNQENEEREGEVGEEEEEDFDETNDLIVTSPTSAKLARPVNRRQTMPAVSFPSTAPRQTVHFASPSSLETPYQHHTPNRGSTPRARHGILRPFYSQPGPSQPYQGQHPQSYPNQYQYQGQQPYQGYHYQNQGYRPMPPRERVPQYNPPAPRQQSHLRSPAPRVPNTLQRSGNAPTPRGGNARTVFMSPAPKRYDRGVAGPNSKRMLYVPKQDLENSTAP
eukprot:TRINITY_DN15230_c0_g1_i1.p1 TRINITY_DN15230_c0_g1~~TRINITY_DN15230_c0_g1_i1.p1  ORF type:complete len:805 (-),score=119.08 TRINITY_DN15230_c0_g1_i1:73-2127(-)